VAHEASSMKNGRFVVGLKQLDLEADQSPPSGAKVENRNSSISSPSLCLHGLDNGSLRIQSVWDIMLCFWGSGFPVFGRIMVPLPLRFNMKDPQFFKVSGTNHPMPRNYILEDWNSLQYLCDNLKSHRCKFTFTF
jgi:hypothetical protein